MTLSEAIQEWEARKRTLQNTCDHCWSEDAEMALQALKDSRWIPCSERMPGSANKVLVLTQNKNGLRSVAIAYWLFEDERWVGNIMSNVIAWRELPGTKMEDEE